MDLQLMHCRPNPIALTTWATRRKLLSPDGDLGYALHALLAVAFGKHAPAPFRYMGAEQGLLAYTAEDEDVFRSNATHAPEEVVKALGLKQLRLRPFPTSWEADKVLGFEARLRPVIRTKNGRERDAYLHRLEQVKAQSGTNSSEPMPSREAVYLEWLNKKFQADNAVQIGYARMEGFSLARILRRTQKGADEKRRTRNITGPDVLFKGELKVTDPIAFAHLLKRGVGRHRAFGYGMLLIRPA
ncbi:type I-E CRISPR-associated protein Cas6/Cse3/CasE [Thiolapillus sp.]|uniref:type I-E CRISPR-associated protein Cas6/Cse3/CasE n=1 Tax=Thiolapillus sp. TaxID=2017437 RepID=UPI003AF86B10